MYKKKRHSKLGLSRYFILHMNKNQASWCFVLWGVPKSWPFRQAHTDQYWHFSIQLTYSYSYVLLPTPPLEKLFLAATSKIQVGNKEGEEHLVPSLSPHYFFYTAEAQLSKRLMLMTTRQTTLARLHSSLWIFPLWMWALQHLVFWHLESSTEHASASGRNQGIPLVRAP